METNIKKLPGSVIEIEATLTAAEFIGYWQPVYNDALKNVAVPGFRPGTAPETMAAGLIDREKVLAAAAREAAIEILEKERSERGWVPVAKPEIEVLEARLPTPGTGGQASAQPDAAVGLRLRGRFTVLPEIALGAYRKTAAAVIAKERREVQVSEEDIEKSVGWLRKSRAKVTRVDRPAATGDLLEADVKSETDGKEIAGGQLPRDRFTLGESRFIPGFDDALVGKRAGETATFTLTAPADYWHGDLRGKDVSFTVTIRGVFNQEVPEFTDEFAKTLGSSFARAQQVRESIRDGLKAEAQTRERDRVRARILEEVIKGAKADVPEVMIESALNGLVAEVSAMNPKDLESVGQTPKSDSVASGQAALRAQLKDRARQRTLANLVLYQIAKDEKLEPTPEEVEKESRAAGIDPEKNYDYSYAVMRNKKVFAFLEKG